MEEPGQPHSYNCRFPVWSVSPHCCPTEQNIYSFILNAIVMDRREEDILRKLGQRLTYLREKQNLTIAELAARSGLDPDIIGKIEAGGVDPALVVIFALVEALDVPPGELVDGL